MKILAFIMSTFSFASLYAQNGAKKFELRGHISGKTSDYVYLTYNIATTGIWDSVRIVKGDFSFTGMIEYPVEASLCLKEPGKRISVDDKNYTEVYLVPGKISFTATADALKAGVLVGSAPELENRWLRKKKHSLLESRRNIYDILYPRDKGDSSAAQSLRQKKDSLEQQLIVLKKEEFKIDSAFIFQHPSSYVAMDVLTDCIFMYKNVAFIQAGYNQMDAAVRNTLNGKRVADYLLAHTANKEGALPTPFFATDVQGNHISLASFKNKQYVLLDFWASWCLPCRQMTPKLIALYNKYKDDLQIIGISLDEDKNALLAAIKKDGMKWVHLQENTGITDSTGTILSLNKAYHIPYIPTYILIGKNGYIDGVFSADTLDKLSSKLESALSK